MKDLELTYGLIGDGKLASHFVHYLELKKLPFKQWSRRLFNDNKVSNIQSHLSNCDYIIVLLKDDIIESFIESSDFLKIKQKSGKLIHCSGSLVMKQVQSFHPLMTFSDELYSIDTYESISFISETNKISFDEVFPELQNKSFEIESSKKELYHALCVLGGNFTTMLWQKVLTEMKLLGIEESAVVPYMQQTISNLEKNYQDALTGPLARKDLKTIEKNINSLRNDPYKDVYKSFVKTKGLSDTRL